MAVWECEAVALSGAIRGNHFATTNSIRSGIKVYHGPPAARRSKTTLAFSFTLSLLSSGVSQGIKSPVERVRGKIVPLTLRYTR